MISIIVPVYNAEAHLVQCIESLLAQQYKEIEILLIDDGSKDQSGIICDKYAQKDCRIRVFHKTNGGVSSARNLGIVNARGEYFVCVDSDDYVEADYILELNNARLAFPDAGNIWCGFQTVSDYEKNDVKAYLSGTEYYGIYDRKEIMHLHSLWLDTSPCTKLYCTDYIRKKHITMDEECSLGEDMLFNYQYLDSGEHETIIVVNKPLYNYVRGGNQSLDTKYRENLPMLYDALMLKVLSYLTKWRVDEFQMRLFWNDFFYAYEKALRNTMRTENRMPFLQKIKCNNSILKSTKFQKIYSEFTGEMHPLLRKAYTSKNYLFVLAVELLAKIKHTILNHKK